MRYVVVPNVDEMSIFHRLSDQQSEEIRQELYATSPEIREAYSHYATASRLPSLSPARLYRANIGPILQSNYDILRYGKCSEIGDEILRRSRTCCLCGFRDSAQLDHHLPKKLFPEYSALTLNLIPVCGPCNQKKGQAYRRTDGGAAFLHAYRDRLPQDEQFLTLQVRTDPTMLLTYSLFKCRGMDDETFAAMQHQFERLNLRILYGDQATEELLERRVAIYEYHESEGALGVSKYLEREARSVRGRHGANHWKSVLLGTLASDDQFCRSGFVALDTLDE